jgi:hypothetical protein
VAEVDRLTTTVTVTCLACGPEPLAALDQRPRRRQAARDRRGSRRFVGTAPRRSWETSPVGCADARTARSTGPARPSFRSEDNAWTQERPRMRDGSRSGRVASAATRAGGRSFLPISVVRRPVVSGVRSAPRMAQERRATRDRRAAPSARLEVDIPGAPLRTPPGSRELRAWGGEEAPIPRVSQRSPTTARNSSSVAVM